MPRCMPTWTPCMGCLPGVHSARHGSKQSPAAGSLLDRDLAKVPAFSPALTACVAVWRRVGEANTTWAASATDTAARRRRAAGRQVTVTDSADTPSCAASAVWNPASSSAVQPWVAAGGTQWACQHPGWQRPRRLTRRRACCGSPVPVPQHGAHGSMLGHMGHASKSAWGMPGDGPTAALGSPVFH